MKNTIEIAQTTFVRLEQLAEGFDTPEAVIIRLLDNIDGKTETKPTLHFDPVDEAEFKLRLIESKEAEVVIYKNDDSREIVKWKANRLSESSNLRGNLWSGLLRGWKSKQIKSVHLSILPQGLNLPDDDTEQRKSLAQELGLTYDEISQLDYDISENASNDGLVYNFIVQFDENCDEEILGKIEGLHDHLWINVSISTFD
jgi:hypothetical protein